ncbi:LIM-domain binding protein [Boletus coccyginus]|nr:LIM-domain binding protein [Boletus coccyginus]
MAPPLGLGQGLIRLLQFSGVLSSENSNKHQLSYWDGVVRDYFTPKAIMKVTLWKDNQRNEAKPFEIGVPILPRFFLVTTQSGVKSMALSLDGARERLLAQHHAILECASAVWTYKYTNGYTVMLRGPLTVHVFIVPLTSSPQPAQSSYTLRFDHLQFDAHSHEKFISLEGIAGPRTTETPKTPRVRNAPTPSPNGASIGQREEDRQWDEPRILIDHASIPGEPVNAFGIPQATMRCLELAESVSQMTDLIAFANETQMGPMGSYATPEYI